MLDIQEELKESIVHRQLIPVKKEYSLIGSMVVRRNQKLFAFNTNSVSIYEVKTDKTVVEIKTNGTFKTRTKAQHDPNCLYCPAYNQKQATRHFIKFLKKHMDADSMSFVEKRLNGKKN